MRERTITKFRPDLEPLEGRRPLSASASAAPSANLEPGSRALVAHPADPTGAPGSVAGASGNRDVTGRQGDTVSERAVKPNFGFLVYRLTNPNRFNNTMIPPFGNVLVQSTQPVPGQVYNVLSVIVRNGTAQTFDANSDFFVKLAGQQQLTPILTGNEQWKPGQRIVFYVLTKKYYPLKNQVTDGFQFFLGGAKSVAIPGPSGIFLRLKYEPATFDRTLDAIVAFGPGAAGGSGVRTGMVITNIFEFLSAKTERSDFGGLF